MKIIRNRFIPFGRHYGAINLFGVLFVKRSMGVTPEVINHERIHTAQMRELLFLPFYLIYILEWLLRLVQTRGAAHRAYHLISFEREAYRWGSEVSYLRRRKAFAQWRESNR